MPIRALTIDFWNTMVIARTGGAARQAQRMAHLARVARAHNDALSDADLEAAFAQARARFDAAWREQHHTPATSELVRHVWQALDIEVDSATHAETVTVFEEGLLYGPPDLADGLVAALSWAAERYALAIISDTMFSPGRVIRKLLDQRGVAGHFNAFVFSDETGVSKPHVRAYACAASALGVAPDELVHIGDLRRTDVAGAHAFGARAILYSGVHEDPDRTPEPHATLTHWHHLPDVLHHFDF